MRIAVAGASGYVGGELLRLALGHPEVEVGALTAGDSAGSLLGAHQPHLTALADRPVEARRSRPSRVTTSCSSRCRTGAPPSSPRSSRGRPGGRLRRGPPAARTPRRGSAGTAASTPGPGPTGSRSCPARAPALRGTRRIAVPGATRRRRRSRRSPPSASGLVGPEVSVVAFSGTSGAGRAAKAHLLGSEVMGSATAYGVGGAHRHTPEIIQNLSGLGAGPVTVSFTPVLAPMPRGILAVGQRPAGRPRRGRGRGPAGVRQDLRPRAVRAPAARGRPAGDQERRRREHRPGAGRGGRRRRVVSWPPRSSTT